MPEREKRGANKEDSKSEAAVAHRTNGVKVLDCVQLQGPRRQDIAQMLVMERLTALYHGWRPQDGSVRTGAQINTNHRDQHSRSGCGDLQ
jgi:hypothetical protein